jgi:hypothetical protein
MGMEIDGISNSRTQVPTEKAKKLMDRTVHTVLEKTVKQLNQNEWDAVTNRDSTKFIKE